MSLAWLHPALRAMNTLQITWMCRRCRQHYASSNQMPRVMRAWQATGYHGVDKLALSTSAPLPLIRDPNDILIRVHAASVNHIDAKMLGGYGSSMLNILRISQCLMRAGTEFPLIPGRDFSGVVVSVGPGTTASDLRPGDEVWGAVLPVRPQGSLAEYVVAPAMALTKKPEGISHVEAASIPYAALTAWAALCTRAGLSASNAPRKRVLILGGSGGVGTFSIQLLRSWGAEVTVTCPENAIPLVTEVGADVSLDYKSPDVKRTLDQLKGFHVILDCTGDQHDLYSHLLASGKGVSYITLNSPIFQNADQHGVVFGAAKSFMSLVPRILQGQVPGQNYHWALVQNSQKALRMTAELVSNKQVRAVLDKKFDFADVPAAFRKLVQGPNRGKTVINMSALIENPPSHNDIPAYISETIY